MENGLHLIICQYQYGKFTPLAVQQGNPLYKIYGKFIPLAVQQGNP